MNPQTATAERDGWTAETFASFWAKPEIPETAATNTAAGSTDVLSEDVVGYWPGEDEPVRGREAYVASLKELLHRVPDLTLSVAESADQGEYVFIRWVAHASGVNGPIEQTGVDRVKVVDGKVAENRIFFDRAQFEGKLGVSLDL